MLSYNFIFKIRIFLFLFITSNISIAFARQPLEIKSNELFSINSKCNISDSAQKAISNKIKNTYDSQYACIDLNYDKTNEIIVKSHSQGGVFLDAYLFFENKDNLWHHILTLTGGFILNNQHPDSHGKSFSKEDRMYYTITQWQRVGGEETWQSSFAYRKNKYIETSSQRVPLTVLYQKDFQKMLLEINNHPSNGYWN